MTNRYAIAPHHSGVYPVHEPLYQAWKDIWNISVTSTEEYPHLRPDHLRKGYVHNELRVLPRQTCGLFTKNLYYNQYPNGPEVLEKSIQGGELFQTIVNNPISVFMTHMPNYAFDRLAPYTFESVIKMLKCWTNLEIQTKEPLDLADQYFNMFPDEITPIWGVSYTILFTKSSKLIFDTKLFFRILVMTKDTWKYGQSPNRATDFQIFS